MKLSTALRRQARSVSDTGCWILLGREGDFIVQHMGRRVWSVDDNNRWCLMLLLLAEIAEGEGR